MGSALTCLYPKENKHYAPKSVRGSSGSPRAPPPAAGRKTAPTSAFASPAAKETPTAFLDDDLIRKQALEAVLLFKHHQSQKNGSFSGNFDRSTSVRDHPLSMNSRKQNFPRSSSTRPRSSMDSLVQPRQLLNQDFDIETMETKHFVLVHGGGFGAWCWYKTIAFLEQSGFKVDAVELTGSGIHSFDTNSVTSLAQYVKPLTDFLEKLGDGEKVILVGHDFGGACISYAMELFPSKVSKAVFIAAAMLANGQSTLDIFSQQANPDGLMQHAQIFLYGNGKDHLPTAIDLDKALLRDMLFNQTPDKDIALASVSMRPIPFAPVLEKLSLSDVNYGSVRRFYIKTQEDCAVPISLQEAMIKSHPPEQVFQLKGSDHSPFFSKPQALHRVLVEISKIGSKQVSPLHESLVS